MYKPCWMSVPLIVMLTACGGGSDDSNPNPTPDPKEKKTLSFIGDVYDGPIVDATVSIYAGDQLLASGKTNADGKYNIKAAIETSVYEKIKTQPITYRALRDDIILYQYDGKSLEEAFKKQENSALISNFSTVEYILADTDNNDFVSRAEWDLYLAFDRNYTEPLIIRYGTGLKSIIDYSASLDGYKNTTQWLRALRNEAKWDSWYQKHTAQYKQAWDALFSDTWFIEQEKHRFKDITSWKVKLDEVTAPDFNEPVAYGLSITGIPNKASVGDKVTPKAFALFTNMTSKNVTSKTTYTVSPADALESKGTHWVIKKAGFISVKAQYQDVIVTETIAVDMGDTTLTSITLSGVNETATVGDKLTPKISASWSNGTTSDISALSEITYSPRDALKFKDGYAYIATSGEITLTASYMSETSTVVINAQEAVLTGLELSFDQRKQFFGKPFQIRVEGKHENGYILDLTRDVEWTSSDVDIIQPIGNGMFNGRTVGTATLTATYGDFTVSQDFDVVAELQGLSLNLPHNQISREESIQLTLNGEYSDGSVSVINEDIVWNSSNPEHLTIDENGMALGVLEGESLITATYKEHTLEETVKVIAPKIVDSYPRFNEEGVMILDEGVNYDAFKFSFTRSNGVTEVYEVEEKFHSFSDFNTNRDASNIQIGQLDLKAEDGPVMIGARAGETELKIYKASVEFQQVLVELGAIKSASDYPDSVTIPVEVKDNANVYQWHRLPLNDSIKAVKESLTNGSLELIQATVSGDAVYRFWQVDGLGTKGPLYVTKVTSEGESEAKVVGLPTEDFKLRRSRMINSSSDYIFLVTSNHDSSGVMDEDKAYRYNPVTGELLPIPRQGERETKWLKKGYVFAKNGDLLSIGSSTISTYNFKTAQWNELSKIKGDYVQLPNSHDQIGILEMPSYDNYFSPPVLKIINLETLEISEQEFMYPGDTTFTCSSRESVSIAVRDTLQNSGAGCLVTDEMYKNAVGYFLWDSIAEEPQLHKFAPNTGDILNSAENYGVATIKEDGHIAYTAGKRSIEQGAYIRHFEVAEIVDIEVDGSIEQQVIHSAPIKETTGDLYSKYERDYPAIDGTAQTISNPDVPAEVFGIFEHGIALKGENGNWNTNHIMFGFPRGNHQKNYHIGDTIILSHEGTTDEDEQQYWQLQLRKPPVNPEPEPEPNPEPEPEPEPTPES
ncbi:hypothetical protein A3K86_21400 [Photobacterium jeanii]|uniref:Cell surface protein n=1 Tax=Photobacterium jeanii TaxID=858640 RepID=A0A178K2H9_9GAMM|nr:hypothetical protein [Photobacterium jeanii]OAN11491.1 hypothetical protein A3K86_21400 [Photobacterium jeanii]